MQHPIDHRKFKRRGILYQSHDINKLIKHQREKLDHISAKTILFYILRELKHDVITEFEIVGLGIGDVLDFTTNTIYEIETHNSIARCNQFKAKYKQIGTEILIVQTYKLSKDLTERYRQLKELIIPD